MAKCSTGVYKLLKFDKFKFKNSSFVTRSRFGRRFLEIYKDHDFLSERLCQAENVAKQFIGEIVDNAIVQIDNENSGIGSDNILTYFHTYFQYLTFNFKVFWTSILTFRG